MLGGNPSFLTTNTRTSAIKYNYTAKNNYEVPVASNKNKIEI